MYKLYAQRLDGSMEKITVEDTIEKIDAVISELSPKEYYLYMVKTRVNGGDDIVKSGKLYEECKVEFVDDIKSKVEVKAMTFKPSRMKKKEELMREVRDYIDR